MKNCSVGIDLGGTKIKIAIVDDSGRIVQTREIPTHASDGPDVIQTHIIETYKQLCSNVTPLGIGIGVAGQIDPKDGTIIFAPNLQWHNVPLQRNLSQSLGCPVVAIGDVKAAAIGEWQYGAAKGCNNFVCLFIGTGIGGGIIINGQMIQGSSNTAGELGHTVIDMRGPKCTCGNWGCLEAVSSGWAIARDARQAINENPSKGTSLLAKCNGIIDAVTAKMVTQAYQEADSLSQQIIAQAVDGIVSGCVSIVNGINPELIILGGGVSSGIPDLIHRVEKGIQQRALAAAQTNLQIRPALLHNDAGVIGAAYLARISSQ